MTETSHARPLDPESVAIDLTPFGPDDYKRLAGWIDSPELLAHWGGSVFEHPLDELQLARHLATDAGSPSRRLVFKAVERQTGRAVGHGELGRIVPTDGSAAVSRVLVPKEHRRRGLGTAIVEGLAEKAFAELGLHRLEVRAFVSNEIAIELYRRCGFLREGVLREAGRIGSRHESLLVLSMLEDDWRALREAERP